MKKGLHISLLFLVFATISWAQGTVYGLKGGLTIANQSFQTGGTSENSLLFKYHGALSIESAPEDNTSTIFAQVGYHTRGHARRFRRGVFLDPLSNQLRETGAFTQEFIFQNAMLMLGFKRRGVLNNEKAYYAIGMRGEYTLKTNLPKLENAPSIYALYFPTQDFVRKFNFGLSLTGGYEHQFSEFVGAFVELSVHPDISRQYWQRPIPLNLTDPFTGQLISNIPEQSIRNLTFELSIGIRFLRKVIYVD